MQHKAYLDDKLKLLDYITLKIKQQSQQSFFE